MGCSILEFCLPFRSIINIISEKQTRFANLQPTELLSARVELRKLDKFGPDVEQ